MQMNLYRFLSAGLLLVGLVPCAIGDDWPGWMGSDRSGVWRETGVVDRIPDEGLPVLWRTDLGEGYSGPAIAQGRVFVTDYRADNMQLNNNPSERDARSGSERVLCLDLLTGKQLWQFSYPRSYNLSYAAGPRATPTVDGSYVYTLGAEGDLICLQCSDGKVVWQKQLAEEYQSPSPLWGHAAHPLVHENLIYCLAGGKGSVVVALDKRTGSQVWQALSASEMGYCPPTIANIAGRQQLIVWHSQAICGLDLNNGQTLWTYPLAPKYGMSICAPRFRGDRMFACGIGDTAAMVEFDSSGQPAKTLWTGKPKYAVYGSNATPLWLDHAIYGADCQLGAFVAVDPDSGQRLWESFALTSGTDRRSSHGTAFMVQNDWRSFLFAETGHLILAKLSRSGFEELGRMQVLEPTGECFGRPVVWSHPAFAQRCMVARNDKQIVCVNLAADSQAPRIK